MGQYNFTDGVRQALQKAHEEAVRLRHEYVGTEHILLGLLATDDAIVAALLAELSLSAPALRGTIEDTCKLGSARRRSGESLPYTSRGKKVLELGMTEARIQHKVLELGMTEARTQHSEHIGCEHLFAGLVLEGKGIAAMVLSNAGVDLPSVRNAIKRINNRRQDEGEGDRGQESSVQFRVDDQSDRSIYEQLIAQIDEAIATSKLKPGDRLPTVRHLADQLDIAPGTVARAYGELERRGAIETDGTRGTRVAAKTQTTPASERSATLIGLLRPVAVATFHLGGTADELRSALEEAMRGVLVKRPAA